MLSGISVTSRDEIADSDIFPRRSRKFIRLSRGVYHVTAGYYLYVRGENFEYVSIFSQQWFVISRCDRLVCSLAHWGGEGENGRIPTVAMNIPASSRIVLVVGKSVPSINYVTRSRDSPVATSKVKYSALIWKHVITITVRTIRFRFLLRSRRDKSYVNQRPPQPRRRRRRPFASLHCWKLATYCLHRFLQPRNPGDVAQ